ncbi:MAG TPA: hypothetical protein V6D11_01440 [Waterburya sp.]|jgi:hypothetical protein
MLKAIRKGISFPVTTRLTVAIFTSACLILGKAEIQDSCGFSWLGVQPAAAQFSVAKDAWRQVYQRLPNLPLENQYVSKETGKVDENSTLIGRLIRYHVFVKSRPPMYRLDWKLTLADYLDANEYLVDAQYPGVNDLRENPMEGDRKAIQKLTRSQRDALVNVLVSIFRTNSAQAPTPTSSEMPSTRTSPPPPTPSNSSTTPSLPKPGDAQLLKP